MKNRIIPYGYRIEDGKLAEHWDVVEHNVQDIVPVHDNGLF